jgi:hypothetical protein
MMLHHPAGERARLAAKEVVTILAASSIETLLTAPVDRIFDLFRDMIGEAEQLKEMREETTFSTP